LSSRQSGVFISNQRGLVVWSIPRNQDLAKYRAEARQFFLDSDLIVGAIANNHQLVIIARERTESLLRLPPLRFETALTLAAETSDELGQSYERNHLFAGQLSNRKDWAPIFLSDGLVNTELGSLLNITDQLLKSWSLDGNVEYINFDYPKPLKWAPFPRSMRNIVEEGSSILFNWNTQGVGYDTPADSTNILFALNRTGSLPITYDFESKSVQIYEKIAYDYFAGLNNPDFARVVQYTALYQIFRNFNISTKESTIQGTLLPGNKVIALETALLLEELQAIPPEKLTELFQEISKNLQSAVEQGELDPKTANSLKNNFLAFNHKMEKLIKALKQGKERWSDDAILQLAVVTASPRTYIPRIKNPQLKDWIFSTYELLVEPDIRWFLSRLSDKEQLKERYVEAFNGEPNTWIKTPSIVLSQYKSSETVSGGHNLDSRLTRLQPNPAVPVGKIRVARDRVNLVILYNPSDIGRIHPLIRKLATELPPDKLLTETEFKNLVGSLENAFAAEPTLNRSLTQALDLPSTYPTQIRGLSPALEPPMASPPLGWGLRDKPLTPDEIQRLLIGDQLGSRSIIIERLSNGYAVLRSGNNQVVEAHTITSFYDELLPQFMRSIPDGDPPIKIYLNGFTPDEAQALALTGSLRQKTQQISFRRDSDFSENMALLKRSYNWDRAIIKEVKTEPFSVASKSGERVIIDIEIPSISPNVPSLKMRIITFLKELPKEIADKIAAIVQRVLNRPTTQKRTVNQIAFDIHKELRKEFPDIDLGVQIEAGDIYITQPVRSDYLARR
jgi:hypothetical protein